MAITVFSRRGPVWCLAALAALLSAPCWGVRLGEGSEPALKHYKNIRDAASGADAAHKNLIPRGANAERSICSASLVHEAADATPRVVSIGDLHGDYDHARALLIAAGLIEDAPASEADVWERCRSAGSCDHLGPEVPFSRYRSVKWIGGNTTVVQTGDLVDRGTYARDLYALFADLRRQAEEAGGKVINLVGNHELMNVLGDLRYVTPSDNAEFGGWIERKKAFFADGWIGTQILNEYSAAAVAGETLFVHAGIMSKWLANGVEALNERARIDMRAAMTGPSSAMLGSDGPFWLRRLNKGDESACSELSKTLVAAGAKRMVVGHTQVLEGDVRPLCDGRLLMADTIISENAYPTCWGLDSRDTHGCDASMSYVEVLGDEAFSVRLTHEDGQEKVRKLAKDDPAQLDKRSVAIPVGRSSGHPPSELGDHLLAGFGAAA